MVVKNDRYRNVYKILYKCWIKRKIESEGDGFLIIYLKKLNNLEEKYYLNVTTLKMKYINWHKTLFKDILAALSHCIKHPVISTYRHEILWHNNNIKVEGNTIMYLQWYSSGIKYFETYDNAVKWLYTFRRLKEKYAHQKVIFEIFKPHT